MNAEALLTDPPEDPIKGLMALGMTYETAEEIMEFSKKKEEEDPNRRCQCGHKRKKHGTETAAGSTPWCEKCDEAGVENPFHAFTETVVPAVLAEAPRPPDEDEGWVCGDCHHLVPHGQEWCSAPRCQEIAHLRMDLAAAQRRAAVGLPSAVVWDDGGQKSWEAFVPPGWAVSLMGGGILISHEDHEVARILSVRVLNQGEKHAAEGDHQHEDRGDAISLDV